MNKNEIPTTDLREYVADLSQLALRFDGYRENETAEDAAALYEDAAGRSVRL